MRSLTFSFTFNLIVAGILIFVTLLLHDWMQSDSELGSDNINSNNAHVRGSTSARLTRAIGGGVVSAETASAAHATDAWVAKLMVGDFEYRQVWSEWSTFAFPSNFESIPISHLDEAWMLKCVRCLWKFQRRFNNGFSHMDLYFVDFMRSSPDKLEVKRIIDEGGQGERNASDVYGDERYRSLRASEIEALFWSVRSQLVANPNENVRNRTRKPLH